MGLRDLTPAEFARLSSLLDAALERPADEREPWLDDLGRVDPATAAMLRDLLAAEAANRDGFLETREIVARRLERAAGDDDEPLEGRRFGPWRALRPLGRGGMGTVWLAERADGLFQRHVALKLVHRHLPRAAFERFAREREILASLDHPNIARLLDAGVADDGRPYLALDYVEGEPLTAWCDARHLSTRRRVELFLQATSAVAFAHAHLVVHRDLKPSNVLVNADGQLRLLDFGIATLLRDGDAQPGALTQLAGRAFTPQYASPEQVAGSPVRPASDVYALGVMLYELLAGCRPYRLSRDTAAALEDAILRADPGRASAAPIDAAIAARRGTSVRGLRRELAGDLDTIVQKAMRKAPADRYPTADALAEDLRRYLRGEPVLARPPGAAYHARKFVARHRGPVAAGAVAVVALVVGTGAALWQAHEARQQALRAEREATKARVVQSFLLDLFRANSVEQGDPLKAQATTARELLDLGAKRSARALDGLPEVQVEVFGTLADMYYQLGLTDEAALRQRDAVAAARRAYGDRDARVAHALMSYADAIVDSSRRAELLATLDEARDVLDASGDTASEARGRLLTMYAKAHSYTSVSEARRYADEALAVFRSLAGTPRLQAALQLAAAARRDAGDYEGALSLHREALAEARRKHGARSSAVVIPLVGIAQLHALLLDVEEAERHYREAVVVSRQVYGERHGETLQSEAKLARLLHGTGRRDEARVLLDGAGRKVAEAQGTLPDFVVAVIAGIRGLALLQEGRVEEAAPLIALDLADARAHYPGSTPLLSALRAHMLLLATRGRYVEAVAAADEALALALALSAGGDPARSNRVRLDRALVLVLAGRPQAALDALADVVAPRHASRLPLPADDVQRRVIAAQALLALGRVDEATATARAAVEAVERSIVRRFHPVLEADAAQRLGEALHRAGDPRAARSWLERAVALREAQDWPSSPWLADARLALAACLADVGERTAAASLARRARDAVPRATDVGPHFRVAEAARR